MKPLNLSNQISLSQIRAEICRRSFYEFFKEFWDTIEAVNLVDNWHIKFICDELQACYEVWEKGIGQPDIFINVPPGSSKSTICTQLFPAWLWIRNPSIRLINSSYSSDLSTAHAVKTRTCIGSDKYKLYYSNEWQVKAGEDNKTWYKNTKFGERYATSTGGTVTGMHADFIIVDDPIKPSASESITQRTEANKHLKETLSTRKTDKERSVTIVIMQRLHEEDPTGLALNEKPDKIRHICLPAELSDKVKPESAKENYKDGLLDTKRLSKAVLEKSKIDLGSYGYAGQMGQNPSPEGGGQLKKAWFGKISREEYNRINAPVKLFLDTAYTSDQKNDPTALMATKYFDNCLYIGDSTEVWEEFPELIKTIPSYADKQGYGQGSQILIEPKASGKSVVQQFRRSSLNVTELDPPTDDKITRVSAISPTCEAGKVFIVEGAWNDNFLGQCAAFPNGAHDDQVDNLVNAINHYQKNRRIKTNF